MEINGKTRLSDIIAAYPWLPETVAKMDERLRFVNTPIGRMLIRNATVADASKKSGYSVEQLIEELNKLIANHESK